MAAACTVAGCCNVRPNCRLTGSKVGHGKGVLAAKSRGRNVLAIGNMEKLVAGTHLMAG